MNLVERAAKRLEELGKAGAHLGGELAHPSTQGQTGHSFIERAVRTHVDHDRDGQGSGSVPPDTPLAEVPARSSVIGGAEPLRAQGAAQRTQRVALDLSKFVSAGYLQTEDSESENANEFRKIKRPLIKACQGKSLTPIPNANRIMVTSSVPGEGKSFVAFNLALSIAMERDSTVLLIDADTTRPKLSQLAGLESNVGLLDLLAEGAEVSDALFRTNIDRLTLLPAGAGRRHATELLASTTMERLVQHLASRYQDRILIFDAPPLLGAPEPAVLASHMGQIIVVVEADKTMHKVLTKALTTIQSCPVVTTVLNKASSTEQGYFYAG